MKIQYGAGPYVGPRNSSNLKQQALKRLKAFPGGNSNSACIRLSTSVIFVNENENGEKTRK